MVGGEEGRGGEVSQSQNKKERVPLSKSNQSIRVIVDSKSRESSSLSLCLRLPAGCATARICRAMLLCGFATAHPPASLVLEYHSSHHR